MFRCSWCMKKIGDNEPLSAINVKFNKGFDFSDYEGTITQVYLQSRKTSVPMIVTAADSEAKKHGQDGMFAVCSDKCGEKMKGTLKKEINRFSLKDAD